MVFSGQGTHNKTLKQASHINGDNNEHQNTRGKSCFPVQSVAAPAGTRLDRECLPVGDGR